MRNAKYKINGKACINGDIVDISRLCNVSEETQRHNGAMHVVGRIDQERAISDLPSDELKQL